MLRPTNALTAVAAAVVSLALAASVVDSYGTSLPTHQAANKPIATAVIGAQHAVVAAAVSAALLTSPLPALASDTAAQISLNRLPPSSISVEIKDLPIVGSLLSGTYTKVPDGSIKGQPSVVIKSPKDKGKAISSVAGGGHLEFDVSGLLNSHLDVDLAADQPGVMRVRIASGLIPKLPFKNLASSTASSPTGGRESAWNMVTNMGNGESYYYNEKTGETQYDKPEKL